MSRLLPYFQDQLPECRYLADVCKCTALNVIYLEQEETL